MQLDPLSGRAMIAALDRPPVPAPRVRRPWLHLLQGVMELAGIKAELLRHAESPWASATFTGTRHGIALAFNGEAAVADGEAFIAALPDHEFNVPHQIVADASVTSVDHIMAGEPRLTVEVEMLLLEEG